MINEDLDIQIKMLTEFEQQLITIFEKYSEGSDFNDFKKNLNWFIYSWGASRVDIKNEGTKTNSIRVYTHEMKYDKGISIKYPSWFEDKKGKGLKVEYTGEKLNLSFQTIEKGKLNITLRGIYYKDIKQERHPIYINYKNVSINYDNFLDENKLIDHDKPHQISLKARHRQRFNLEIISKTIYTYFPKLKTFFRNIKDEDDLLDKYFDIINYITTEKNVLRDKLNNQKDEDNIKISKNEIPLKKPEIAMFGSCVSIDPFRSCYNNYKKDFKKTFDHQRSSIISLMSNKIDYDDKDLNYLKDDPYKHAYNTAIRKDFNKEIFKHLENLDYLVINLVHDVRWGVLEYNDSYITNTIYIKDTAFYKNNKENLRPINMDNNPQEYFDLWTKAFDEFYRYLSKNYPNLKIILQKIELIYEYITFECSYKIRKDFQRDALKLNPLLKKFESHIENNYDINVIPFPYDTFGDEGNIWGVYSTHYTKTYYQHIYDKIRIISLEDMIQELLQKK